MAQELRIQNKYKLGDRLVTGHRKAFFDEASELYAQKLIELHNKKYSDA